jgi:hypothetical protein
MKASTLQRRHFETPPLLKCRRPSVDGQAARLKQKGVHDAQKRYQQRGATNASRSSMIATMYCQPVAMQVGSAFAERARQPGR